MAAHKALTLASRAAGYRHGHGYGELGDIGKSLNDSSFRLLAFEDLTALATVEDASALHAIEM